MNWVKLLFLIRTPIGLGVRFLIHPDGYIVTNDHVVAGERQISVTQFKGLVRSWLNKILIMLKFWLLEGILILLF